MANAYINVYKNNPTAGSNDGTAVSTDGTNTAPISFTLDASINESQTLSLGIRTEQGYIATNVTISDLNDTNDRLKLCKTADGTFTDSINFDTITATNTLFYIRASSDSSENPTTDRSVSLRVTATIEAL